MASRRRLQLPSGMPQRHKTRKALFWDPWGKQTLLAGPDRGGEWVAISCLEYSSDGEYLASGCNDGSIRLWHTKLFHIFSRERPIRATSQADTILQGNHLYPTRALAFSRTDSNLLASGFMHGVISLWNVKEQAHIHLFNPHCGAIRSLSFVGGEVVTCFAATSLGSIIRLWKPQGSSDFASETTIGEAASLEGTIAYAVFSRPGSFLATSMHSSDGTTFTLALYELETMTKTQSVVIPGRNVTSLMAFSPDNKTLIICDLTGRVRLLQADDFSIQRDLGTVIGGFHFFLSQLILLAQSLPSPVVAALRMADM